MRLWSIHPKYLDAKGLVAVWREGLLAKHVLEGRTKGYINHPQLLRFRQLESPLIAINAYLLIIHDEALVRGYSFSRNKIDSPDVTSVTLPVTRGQIQFEFKHLLSKLEKRAPELFHLHRSIQEIELNPLFIPIQGEIETWERL